MNKQSINLIVLLMLFASLFAISTKGYALQVPGSANIVHIVNDTDIEIGFNLRGESGNWKYVKLGKGKSKTYDYRASRYIRILTGSNPSQQVVKEYLLERNKKYIIRYSDQCSCYDVFSVKE